MWKGLFAIKKHLEELFWGAKVVFLIPKKSYHIPI
jgi:hypothetical protein